ncbi:MAG: hypothetical protein EPO23_00050 [Xanthobacteraceae bacterium]|nr:MAG: hypothetical protein EPO23_00050 [Xanthobacteraceae bacterium]
MRQRPTRGVRSGINEALEKTLTRERLNKYLIEANQDFDQALRLYERNTKLSESFYTPLQCLEVCFRNSLYRVLTNDFNEEWYEGNKVPLSSDSRRMVLDARDELIKDRKEITPGQMVAELKFAFWVGLLGPHYDATIWRTTLHKAFLAGGGKPRSVVHGRFNAIRRLRNRIAHHEPIFHRPLEKAHTEIIEAISWMCRDTANWASHHSRFAAVFAGSE